MRIIGGVHKGRIIKTPNDLPVRPTTDFAKEALFNILQNQLDFDTLSVLDLFSGTGHIALEFASRGCAKVVSVDKNFKCTRFIGQTAAALNLNVEVLKDDVFNFLKKTTGKFDLVFADPPYDLPNIEDIHRILFEGDHLNPNALLIIEHGEKTHLDNLNYFVQHRRYGGVNFSFFRKETVRK